MTTAEKIDRKTALDLYRVMRTIRSFEERSTQLFGENKIWGTIHSYAGEEAIAAGVCANLRDDDWITSTHRGHGHCIAKGADLGRMFAELLGRETGYCRGRSTRRRERRWPERGPDEVRRSSSPTHIATRAITTAIRASTSRRKRSTAGGDSSTRSRMRARGSSPTGSRAMRISIRSIKTSRLR